MRGRRAVHFFIPSNPQGNYTNRDYDHGGEQSVDMIDHSVNRVVVTNGFLAY